jgi:CHAT domain-containing protein
MPTSELGERFSGLERAAPARRGWSAALLRGGRWMTAARIAALVGIGYLLHDGPFAPHDRDVPSCIEAFAAQRWQAASDRCARAADRTGDPAAGVRAAGALLRLNRSDPALQAAQRWFGSPEDATARQIAGAVYFERDDLERAIPMLELAFAGHTALANHVEASRDQSYVAGAYLHAGRLGDALDAAQSAVREADLTGPSEAHAQLRGRARLKVGKLLTEIGDPVSARTALWEAQQALATWPADQAWVALELGQLAQSVDDQASAATLFEHAVEVASEAGVSPVVTAARLNLAYAQRELGQLDAAEHELRALDADVRDRPMALFIAGLVAADRGQSRVAEQLLARAALDAPTDDYAMDIAFQRGRLAERASDAAAAERFYRSAIELVEKLRETTDALGLRPLILARRQAPYRKLVALLAEQNRRVDALMVAEQLHARSWRDALVAHTGADGIRARVSSAQALGRQLHRSAARELTLDEVLAIARRREILVFAEDESDLLRFRLVDGVVDALDRVPERARSLVERWREAPDDPGLAAELGDLLIPPAVRAPSSRPLYLVANGVLGDLPFAALRPGGRFLVETRVLSRLPGLAALRCPVRRLAQRSSVFLGDSRDDLPAARRETTALAGMLGGRALIGPEATVDQLEASRDAALLHLAIHAEVDRSGARLLLAGRRHVSAADIVEREIGPRVAVLAGCATAVGRDPEGWGALASAFLAAGSRSVVATLHAVDDRDAFEMMRRYYLDDGERHPALALARAQREQIAAGGSAWRAFVMYGSAEPADCADSP